MNPDKKLDNTDYKTAPVRLRIIEFDLKNDNLSEFYTYMSEKVEDNETYKLPFIQIILDKETENLLSNLKIIIIPYIVYAASSLIYFTQYVTHIEVEGGFFGNR